MHNTLHFSLLLSLSFSLDLRSAFPGQLSARLGSNGGCYLCRGIKSVGSRYHGGKELTQKGHLKKDTIGPTTFFCLNSLILVKFPPTFEVRFLLPPLLSTTSESESLATDSTSGGDITNIEGGSLTWLFSSSPNVKSSMSICLVSFPVTNWREKKKETGMGTFYYDLKRKMKQTTMLQIKR